MTTALATMRAKMMARIEILRTFQSSDRERLIEKLVSKRLAPGEEQTATLCVGAPSNFEFVGIPTLTWGSDGEQQPDETPEDAEVYTAIWWELENVRVVNPSDSDQYVITKRIKQVRYSRPGRPEVQLDNRPIFAAFPAGA